MVMNVMVKRRDTDRVKWGLERRAQANRWIKHRNGTTDDTKTETDPRVREQQGRYLLTGHAVSGAEAA